MFSSADNKSLKIGVARSNELTDWSAELGERRTFDWRAQFTYVDFDVIGKDEKSDLMLLKLKKNPFTGKLSSGIKIPTIGYEREVTTLFGTVYTPSATVGKPPARPLQYH